MNKYKSIIIGIIFLIILSSLTVVFASFSETLTITGEAKVKPYAKVRVKKVVFESASGSGYETYNADFNVNRVSMYSSLPNSGDSVKYKIVFQNDYNEDYYIKSVEVIENSNTNVNVVYKKCNVDLVLPAKSEVEGSFTFTAESKLTKQDITYSIKYTFKKKEVPEVFSDYIVSISNNNSDLLVDTTNDKNIRYVGNNPKNYVSFNNELWRVIGVFNNISDGNGNVNSRVKIVRDESIGVVSWDSSIADDPNPGNKADDKGFNDYTISDLMHVLNAGYEENTVINKKGTVYTTYTANNSLYWNKGAGKCTYSQSNDVKDCDFSTNGLLDSSKNYIGDAVWNIAANDGSNKKPLEIYNNEHGNKTWGNTRPTTWTGKVALINASDYGFAVSDTSCYNLEIKTWGTTNPSCHENNWMFNSLRRWTITPHWNNHHYVLYIDDDGKLADYQATDTSRNIGVYPTLFLSSNVKVKNGDGRKTNPYILGL